MPLHRDEDDDIKIASFSESTRSGRENAADAMAALFLRHRSNGNLEKAQKLGEVLAKLLAGEGSHIELMGSLGGVNRIHKELLCSFAVSVAIEQYLPDAVLSQMAEDTFFEEIKRLSPSLHRFINDSGAFSFYYLAYRRGGDVEHSIGKTFATLCDLDEDAVCAELGEAIYCRCISLVAQEVRKQRFA